MLQNFDAYQVARSFHWACVELPLHRVHRDQIFRASSSIVLNIAEGSGKRTSDDQRKHYASALGSLRECHAILDIEKIKNREILNLLDRLGAMLFKLAKPRKTESTIGDGPANGTALNEQRIDVCATNGGGDGEIERN